MNRSGKRTILIANGAYDERSMLESSLKGRYSVLLAENGLQAIEILKSDNRVAAVLLDTTMPELNGFGVIRRMKSDRRLRRIPVIIITNGKGPLMANAAFLAGAADILERPLNPGIIRRRVDNTVRAGDSYAKERRRYSSCTKKCVRAVKSSSADESGRGFEKDLSVEYMGIFRAMRTVYSLSIVVNLTKNNFYILDNERYINRAPGLKGVFDELIEFGVETVPERHKKEFYAAFSRENLLKAFSEGRDIVKLEHAQYATDGRVHWVETIVLRIDNPYDDDVLEFTLARVIDEQKRTEDKLKKALNVTEGALAEKLRLIDMIDAIFPGLMLAYYPGDQRAECLIGTLPAILGYTGDRVVSLIESGFTSLAYPLDGDDIANYIMSVKSELPESFEHDFLCHKANGEMCYITCSAKRFSGEDGKAGYICLITDGTARRELIDSLRISEEELKLSMARMGRIILRYDAAKGLFTLPREFACAVSLPEECKDIIGELSKKGISVAPGDDNIAVFNSFCESVDRGDKTASCEIRVIGLNGSVNWHRIEYVGIFDERGVFARAVFSIEDVTAKRVYVEENRRLRENERIMRAVADNSDRVAYYYNIASNIAESLDKDASVSSNLPPVIINPPYSQINRGMIAPESVEAFKSLFTDIASGLEKGEKKVHVNLGGVWRWLEIRFVTVDVQSGSSVGAVITILDITHLHEQELTYARYIQNMNANDDKEVLFFEADLTLDTVEKQGGKLSPFHFRAEGLSHTDVANYIVETYFDESRRESAMMSMNGETLLKLFAEGKTDVTNDWDVVFSDGKTHWIRSTMQMVTDPYTGHVRLLTVMRDITKEKLDELALHRQASTDGLTGALNRATAESRIKEALPITDNCAMMLFDVDDLKDINDNLGHAQGDNALRLIAKELMSNAADSDVVGRLGGDEFIMFVPNIGEREAREKIASILEGLSKKTIGDDLSRVMRCSAGAVMKRDKSDDFDYMYRKADAALYYVKNHGKNRFAFYVDNMESLPPIRAEVRRAKPDAYDVFSQEGEESLSFIVSMNLTRNRARLINSENRTTLPAFLTIDGFAQAFKSGIDPCDEKRFDEVMSRDALMKARENAPDCVRAEFVWRGDANARLIILKAYFDSDGSEDNALILGYCRSAGER